MIIKAVAILFLAYVGEQALEAFLGMRLGIIGVFVFCGIAGVLAELGDRGGNSQGGGE